PVSRQAATRRLGGGLPGQRRARQRARSGAGAVVPAGPGGVLQGRRVSPTPGGGRLHVQTADRGLRRRHPPRRPPARRRHRRRGRRGARPRGRLPVRGPRRAGPPRRRHRARPFRRGRPARPGDPAWWRPTALRLTGTGPATNDLFFSPRPFGGEGLGGEGGACPLAPTPGERREAWAARPLILY